MKTNSCYGYKKMDKTSLEGLMHMRSRSFAIKPKKGKGSYSRKEKYKTKY